MSRRISHYDRPPGRGRGGHREGREHHRARRFEEYAIILDYIPEGVHIGNKENIAQAIGETWFTLLELIPVPGTTLTILDRVGIGKETRKEIQQIRGRIGVEELTHTASEHLREAIQIIVSKNERRFVEFFNKAQPITTRMHSIELIPGIGKKTMQKILEERSHVPFTSFEDLSERAGIHEPEKLIVERIIKELEGNEKYHLFTRPKSR